MMPFFQLNKYGERGKQPSRIKVWIQSPFFSPLFYLYYQQMRQYKCWLGSVNQDIVLASNKHPYSVRN